MTALVLGHAWWSWQTPVAHARKLKSRQAQAVCGFRLSPKACLRVSNQPLCGECVSILTGEQQAPEVVAAERMGPPERLPPPANPWVSCPCGDYRFRLFGNDERTGADGRWHSVLVCQKRREETRP